MQTLTSQRKTTTRGRRSKTIGDQRLVNFHWDGGAYVLDLNRNKVYQNWMAVETNKGVAILGAYRQSVVAAV